MEIKKLKTKQLCPHKLARFSLEGRSSLRKKSPRVQKSVSKQDEKALIKELQEENERLKAQNNIYHEYFATFEVRYKEQKKENHHLKKQIHQLSKEKIDQSSDRKNESTYMLSEKTITQKVSRTTKESRKTLTSDYF